MTEFDESDRILRHKEAKRTLSTLSRVDVAPLLDRNRLVKSSAFAEIAKMALDHSTSIGDNGPINSTLDLVRDTKYENPLSTWFCRSAGLKEVDRKGRKQLVKATEVSKLTVGFEKFFPAAAEARDAAYRARALAHKLSNPNLRVEIRSHKKGIDMLDSKARLPGSFGSGKRR